MELTDFIILMNFGTDEYHEQLPFPAEKTTTTIAASLTS